MKAKRYDSVVLLEEIGGIPKGSKGAVVEIYTTPCEAYDLEIVSDEGTRTHRETTRYAGKHYVECYIGKNGICVAWAREPVVIA